MEVVPVGVLALYIAMYSIASHVSTSHDGYSDLNKTSCFYIILIVVFLFYFKFGGVQIISGVSLVVYSILSWSKLVIADKISSSSLKTDGECISSRTIQGRKYKHFCTSFSAINLSFSLPLLCM